MTGRLCDGETAKVRILTLKTLGFFATHISYNYILLLVIMNNF